MYGRNPIRSYHMKHTATVYSFDVSWKTNVETTEAALYSSIPCYGYRMNTNKLETLLGVGSQGRWKVLFPLTFSGSDVDIKTGYTVVFTRDGVARKLKVENVFKHAQSHVEVEAVEDEPTRN